MAEEKKQDNECHEQPLPDPRPSIIPAQNFNDDVAKQAAKTLREAMKGFGTNEQKIINVTEGFSHSQRMRIKEVFHSEYNRDLIKDLKSELSGKFEKVCIGFWLDPGQFDAEQVKNAVDGLGFSTKVLNEIICTRTNREIELMKSAWTKIEKKKSLIDRIKSETDKGSGNYCTLLVTLLEGKRPPNHKPDPEKVKADAEMLNRFITQEKESAAKEKFVEIFTTRSWTEIREISGIFSDIAKKFTLQGAIKKAFGDGDTSQALQTINSFASAPYDYWAMKLRDAMKGMGTDDDAMRRVLVARAEVDLRDIGVVFGQRYGDGKTLNNWIKADTSGDYEKLLLAVCGLDYK